MKQITIIGLTLLLLAGSSLAVTMVLGEADGLAETVKVSGYKEGQVKLDRGAGVEMVLITEFSESVQNKILSWYADQMFESSSGLRVGIKKKSSKHDRGENISYEITLENRVEVPQKDLKITSWVFLKLSSQKRHPGTHIYTDFSFSTTLLPRETRVFETKEIPVRDFKTKVPAIDDQGNRYYLSRYIKDELFGVNIIVEKTGLSEKPLFRKAKSGRPPSKRSVEKYVHKKLMDPKHGRRWVDDEQE